MKSDKRGKRTSAKPPGPRSASSSEIRSVDGISSGRPHAFSIQPEDISLTRMLETLKPHDHLCLIYESQEEWRAVAAPFISIGLKQGEKCIYIVDTSTAEEIRKYLLEEGVDVVSAEKSGHLSILHETEAYTREGSFDPDRMIALLISETEKAVSEGYPALRTTSEMTWVLRGHFGSEKLLEYEAKLNRDLFPKYPYLAICQYDRWKFDSEIIKGVIMTHPLLVRGSRVYRNFYYVEPEEFLNKMRAEREVQHWLNNVEREQRMWEELRESEVRFKAQYQGSPIPTFTWKKIGEDFILMDYNNAAKVLTNGEAIKFLEKTANEMYRDRREDIVQDLYRCFAEKGVMNREIRSQHFIPGRFMVVTYAFVPPDLVMVHVEDITERKRAEREQLEMERQLQHSQKLESLGVLAGGIAHDFNNILQAIMGNLEMAQLNLESSSKLRRYIEVAFKASKRAAEITNQMLAYSGRGAFVVKPTDLSAVVDGMAQLLRSSISKTVSLQFDLKRPLPSINADSGQIEQVIMNLAINASEAIGEGSGVVILRTGVEMCEKSYLERSRVEEKPPPGRFVFFEVYDTGCGMDEETQRRLFDPFFTTKFTGRGLGMSAVVGIVRGHKGAILLESEVGKGTRIRVLFPVIRVEEVEGKPCEEVVSKSSGENISGGFSGVVLVVDDEDAVRDLCREELESFGFTVLTAADGEEGVRVFREHAGEITCVILDYMMPKMGGVAAFKELTRIRSDVRVILSSGYDQEEATRHFAGQGLSGFIQKPYGLANLRDTLSLVLQDKGEQIIVK